MGEELDIKEELNDIRKKVSSKIPFEKRKQIITILNLILMFCAGYAIGEQITIIKTNNFIREEYLENPVYNIEKQMENGIFNINKSKFIGLNQTNETRA